MLFAVILVSTLCDLEGVERCSQRRLPSLSTVSAPEVERVEGLLPATDSKQIRLHWTFFGQQFSSYGNAKAIASSEDPLVRSVLYARIADPDVSHERFMICHLLLAAHTYRQTPIDRRGSAPYEIDVLGMPVCDGYASAFPGLNDQIRSRCLNFWKVWYNEGGSLRQLFSNLENDDVYWVYNDYSERQCPSFSIHAELWLALASDEELVERLLPELAEENRCVLAHVLLARRFASVSSADPGGGHFLGLTLVKDGDPFLVRPRERVEGGPSIFRSAFGGASRSGR